MTGAATNIDGQTRGYGNSPKKPRNTKQVKNARSKMLERQRLSHDALYNLHELATDMLDFMQTIRTHPDLVCVCANKALLERAGSSATS